MLLLPNPAPTMALICCAQSVQGLMVLPLLAAVLLAPGAARASFLQASKPMPETAAVSMQASMLVLHK